MAKYNAREVLGVDADASSSQIKKAYHNIARENHPDRTYGLDDETRQQMTEKFQMAQNAYQALNNGQPTFNYSVNKSEPEVSQVQSSEPSSEQTESQVQASSSDKQADVKKSNLEDANKKINEQAATQAAIDKEAKDNAKSEPTDEISSKNDKDDSKKEDKEDKRSVLEKTGGSGMSEGWAKTTMEAFTEGYTTAQDFAMDLNKAIFNKPKEASSKENPTPNQQEQQQTENISGEVQQTENSSEQESLQQIEMQSMSDSKPLMIEGPKADELDKLSASSQNPESSPSEQPSLDDTPSLNQ